MNKRMGGALIQTAEVRALALVLADKRDAQTSEVSAQKLQAS